MLQLEATEDGRMKQATATTMCTAFSLFSSRFAAATAASTAVDSILAPEEPQPVQKKNEKKEEVSAASIITSHAEPFDWAIQALENMMSAILAKEFVRGLAWPDTVTIKSPSSGNYTATFATEDARDSLMLMFNGSVSLHPKEVPLVSTTSMANGSITVQHGIEEHEYVVLVQQPSEKDVRSLAWLLKKLPQESSRMPSTMVPEDVALTFPHEFGKWLTDTFGVTIKTLQWSAKYLKMKTSRKYQVSANSLASTTLSLSNSKAS